MFMTMYAELPTSGAEQVEVMKLAGIELTGLNIPMMTISTSARPLSIPSLSRTEVAKPADFQSENAIIELRRISGLTWDQLAEIMGVDRRTIHFWGSGRPPRPVHQEHLQRVLQLVRRADRKDSAATRALLLDASGGPMLKDLLTKQAFDEAMIRLAYLYPVAPRPRPGAISLEAEEARQPLPLEVRLNLSEEPVKISSRERIRPKPPTRVRVK